MLGARGDSIPGRGHGKDKGPGVGKRLWCVPARRQSCPEHGDQSREGYKLKLERLGHFAPKMQT